MKLDPEDCVAILLTKLIFPELVPDDIVKQYKKFKLRKQKEVF